jgi:hypothetical protein
VAVLVVSMDRAIPTTALGEAKVVASLLAGPLEGNGLAVSPLSPG